MICINHPVLLSCSCFTCFKRKKKAYGFELEFLISAAQNTFFWIWKKNVPGHFVPDSSLTYPRVTTDTSRAVLDLQHRRLRPPAFSFVLKQTDDKLMFWLLYHPLHYHFEGKMGLRTGSQEIWILFLVPAQTSCMTMDDPQNIFTAQFLFLKLRCWYLYQRGMVGCISLAAVLQNLLHY